MTSLPAGRKSEYDVGIYDFILLLYCSFEQQRTVLKVHLQVQEKKKKDIKKRIRMRKQISDMKTYLHLG